MAAAVQPKPEVPGGEPWACVEALPCLLIIEIPVPAFTVSDLVHLQCGRIITTRWTVGQDVPLKINGQLLAWSEFEIVQDRLAVRLTELA